MHVSIYLHILVGRWRVRDENEARELTITPSFPFLPSSQIKIGRQTNAKTLPGERNGYFDTKVLSRTHAEVWQEAGKVSLLAPRRRARNRS